MGGIYRALNELWTELLDMISWVFVTRKVGVNAWFLNGHGVMSA